MPLKDDEIRGFKPAARPYKRFDGHGLYVLVEPTGAKYWRYKFRLGGKEDVFPIGVYPEVAIKKARADHAWARGCVAKGLNPNAVRKKEKADAAAALAAALGEPPPAAVMGENAGKLALPGDTFGAVARAWKQSRIDSRASDDDDDAPDDSNVVTLAKRKPGKRKRKKRKPLSQSTIDKIQWLMDTYLLPKLGDTPELRSLENIHISQLEITDIIPRLLAVEADGKLETAHRMRQRYAAIGKYARAIGKIKHNFADGLEDAIAPNVHTQHAAVTDPAAVGALLFVMDGYHGSPQTRAALKLAPHLFLRPHNLRKAKWRDIDLDAAEWRIGPDDMKMDEKLIVPLSRQAVAILRDIQRITGDQMFVFGSTLHTDRPMSENTVTGALRRLGYGGDEMSWHGFRTLASTLLNENDFNGDDIELQMAHAPSNKVRAIYNQAKKLKQRRRMMQQWSNYLDDLRTQHIARTRRARKAA